MDQPLSVGRVTILPVQDLPISGSRSYMYGGVQEDAWETWLQEFPEYFNPRGNLRLNIGTFVVRSEGRTMLVDTGVGAKNRSTFPNGNLLENLRTAGVAPEDVDVVVITHLHIDHVGWNTVPDGDRWVPAFPRARYVIARPEWEFFTQQPDLQDHIADSVVPLADTGQLDLVEETHRLTSEITLVPAPGHTPAHVCVAIVSGAERAMIIGDLAHHPIQLTETAWNIVMDMNPALAQQTRAATVERLERENAVVVGGHFPPPGIGRLVRLGERRVWQAL